MTVSSSGKRAVSFKTDKVAKKQETAESRDYGDASLI
jgi:hypothetical protein